MKILPVYTLCVVKDTLVSYKNGSLYTQPVGTDFSIGERKRLCKIPMSVKMRLIAHLPLLKRIFRTVPRAAAVISDTAFVFAFGGNIFRVSITTGEIVCEHTFAAPMRAPLSFAEICGIKGFEDSLVYGEYHGNLNNGEMAIYARTANGDWLKRYTFPAGSICHIHGFCPDFAHDRVLILTGDRNEESGFYAATENFDHVEPLLCGSQQVRSCVAFPHKDGILYATDTPLEENALYRIGEDNVLQKLYNMPGPCVFGTALPDGDYLFATSVEPDSRLTGLRYMLTYRLGRGVKERYTHIVRGNPEKGFQTILRLKKDCLPMLLCQFGNAAFITTEQPYILIVPQSLSRYEGKTLCLKEG